MSSLSLAGWVLEALQAIRPPGNMTVSEWADRHRVMESKTANIPGPWRTSLTPYLREIMDVFADPEVEEIISIKSTQMGCTEAVINMIGYAISQDPGSAMVVYPTEDLGEWTVDNRIQPMVNRSPELRGKELPGGKKMDLQFDGMFLAVASAQSPSGLASRPIRYLFLDEVDKYPTNAGKEANPRSLAKERTKTFAGNRKIVEVSTPTLETGPIWQDWLSADSQYKCFVACPHCGAEWYFEFRCLQFDTESPEKARQTAIYACPECGGVITDGHKNRMVKTCKWKPVKEGGRRRIAFHLNAFYSPFVRLGDIAYEFVASKGDQELLQNFINSWLGEPFKQVEGAVNSEKLYDERRSGLPRCEVPTGTVMLTGGVDVQRRGMYWCIKAWLPSMANYTIHNGYAYSWQEVEHVMNQTYLDRDGKAYIINLCGVDSGDQTDDVYDFCARNREWAVPVKGSSRKLQSRYSLTTINKDGLARGLPLCLVDTEYYKDVLYSRFFRGSDEGGWYIYEEIDPEYLEMMTAEHKVVTKERGRMVSHWQLKASGRDNHYWDTEVYATCAADLCGLRTLAAEAQRSTGQIPQEPAAAPAVQSTTPSSGGYFSGGAKASGGYFSKRRW